MENSDESQSQSKLLEMNNLLEGTTPLMRSGESSLGSSSHNLVMGFDGIFRSEKCVKLFQDFLKEQNQVNYLLFWLAVNGFKKVPEPSKADHLARIIYRSFIKSNSEKPVKLNSSTSHEIKVLIDSTPITRSIFDKAHCEVESLLKTTFYPQFTKWDGASKFEFVDGSPSVDNQPGSNFLSQFGLHDSSPANTDSCGDIRVPTNPNVSMASSSALLSGSNPTSTTTTSAGVAPQTTLTGLSAGGGAESESGRCSESACGANGVCAEAQLNNNNCACQQASKSHGFNQAETSLGKESSSNSLLINQQCHFPVPPSKTHQGFSSSSRHQRRGKSQENSIDHRIVKDAANVKLGHHSRPKSNTAAVAANAIGNSISGSSGKKQAGVKSDLACRKPPEILPPHQFAAILIRKLEELQMKQQGLKLASDSQSMCASAMHERNNMESLRHQLLAVSGASSQQVSDMASSSQEDDPNNIIDSHVSRVFRDTQDCGGTSPPVTYSPSTGSICVECTPGSAMLLTKLSRDVSSRVLHGQTGGKLGPNSRRCNRFETCSNLSMSSGVDSGCFDVSSQFSTDSRESDSRSRLSVLNWMQSSSRENSLTGVCPTSKHANNGHFVSGSPCPASRHSNATSGLSRGSSATASRANTRWASLSPHRNMHYSVNNSNNNVIGSLMSAGNAPTLNHNFNPHPLNHALHSMGGVASCQFATSNSCSQPCICACEANVHTLPTYSQKKSRSNSAERPFSGAALQVFKQEIPKATTAESIIGMQSASSEGVVAIAPPQFNQSTGSKTPKQQHKEYSDVNLPSDKKKSSTWSKQRSGDKSRHFNTCAHHLGLSQFQDPFSSHAEVQEDSAFDESCAEDSFFSTCSTEMLKKGGAVCHSSQSSGASSQVMTSSVSSSCPNSTVVAYFFCGEPIPYRTVVQSKLITLADFKSLLTRKGNYRYFFKMRSDEIEIGGIVNEEVTEDDAVLPFFDGKIIGRIEKQSSC